MSSDRPQYGEYATPEEQRRAAGLPPEPVAPAPAPPMPQQAPAAASAPERAKPGRVDRLVTILLLAYGAVNVIATIPGFLDLPTTLTEAMRIMGLPGEFTNLGPARTWGLIAIAVLVIGYGATVFFSLRRIRTEKRAWWVPLVGFVVTMVLVSMCISVPMMGDPAFTSMAQGG